MDLSPWSGDPGFLKLCHVQHTPEPASSKTAACGTTTMWAFSWTASDASSYSGWGHKSRVGWKAVLDNSSGLIHKEWWRGGGGAAEDRQLFKPAANPLQPLTCTQSPAFFQPASKLLGIQELKYTREIYTNTCQNPHFTNRNWLFHRWQKGFHLAFTWQSLTPWPKIPQLSLLWEVLKRCMATCLSAHIPSPPYQALGHRLSCQAKFHPKQFLNTHPINPPKRELVMETLTETWRYSRTTVSASYTSASLGADSLLPHLRFPLVYFG